MAGVPVFLLLSLALFNLGKAFKPPPAKQTGLIITGGEGTETSIETFPNSTCTIPPFPNPGRELHSLSVLENGKLVACGGFNTATSCISWRSGQDEWTHYATLRHERRIHAAVSINNKIIIVGGFDRNSQRSGEIVNEGGTQLTLRHRGVNTCAVPYKTGFVTIGGLVGYTGAHGKVDRYDSEGKYLDSLPDLIIPRFDHGCTSFFTNGEQALLVAGGSRLYSTEIFSDGRWRRGGNLPRALGGLKAAYLNQQVVVTGGGYGYRADGGYSWRFEVLQYNIETEKWTRMDKKMWVPRGDHAIVEANLATLCSDAKANVSQAAVPAELKSSSGSGDAGAAVGIAAGTLVLLLLLVCVILVCYRRRKRNLIANVKNDIQMPEVNGTAGEAGEQQLSHR